MLFNVDQYELTPVAYNEGMVGDEEKTTSVGASNRNRQWFSLGLTGLALSKPNQLNLNYFGVLKHELN